MRHDRPLGFDDLEARKLMTKAPAHKAVAVALVLDGTLAVDQKASSTTSDIYGDTTRTTPVSGVLSGVGKVKGTWTEEADYYGDEVGVSTVRLRDSQGIFTISFDTSKIGKARPTPQGASFKPLSQSVRGGTAAYARASETGSVVLNTNSPKGAVESMTVSTGKA